MELSTGRIWITFCNISIGHARVFTTPHLFYSGRATGVPYRPRTGRRSTCTMVIAVLLLCAGDVELNPGPARLNVNNSARLTADNCSSINVGCLNCRSTGNKAAVIHDINNDYRLRLEFLALSKTWFTSNTPATVMSDISPAGYAALHAPRSLSADREGPSRVGGLSIVFRESVVVRRHRLADEFRPSTCKLQLVRVCSSPSLGYAVFHIYRPQWMSTVPAFADELADMIAKFAAKCNDHVIICSDLNCPGTDSSHIDHHLSTVFDSFSLSELVCTPTRDDNLLDVLVSSCPSVFCDVRVTDSGLVSDHRLVTACLQCRRMKVETSYSSRNIRTINIAKFNQAMRASSLFTAPANTADGFADQLRMSSRCSTSSLLSTQEFDVDQSLHPGGCLVRLSLPSVIGADSNDAG